MKNIKNLSKRVILGCQRELLETFSSTIWAEEDFFVPATPVTSGPGHHWFGYYDKHQFDATGRFLLGMQVDFEHRSPTEKDELKIGIIDLENNNSWTEIGRTKAWSWQQGCMLQWRPNFSQEVIWNDREGDHFVSRILNLKTHDTRTLPYPIYHISPDGKFALGTDFARIQDMRKGYGYAGVIDSYKLSLAPSDSFIYLLDLESGERKKIISIADIEAKRFPNGNKNLKLYFNHLQWSPDAKRFIFFSRGRDTSIGHAGSMNSMAYTSNLEGTDIRFLANKPSHFEWRDSENVLIHAKRAYRLFKDDGSGKGKTILRLDDGHQSYLPNKDWLVTDTVGVDKNGDREIFLYHFPTRSKINIGHFHVPDIYLTSEWRCDGHPRISRDGAKVVIDSPHEGNGRQMYLLNISDVLQKFNLK